MKTKKEPLEIKCSGCNGGFRLWIPIKDHGEWEQGVSINCVRCGVPYIVKKTSAGFSVEAAKQVPPSAVKGAYTIDFNNNLTPLMNDESIDSGLEPMKDTPQAEDSEETNAPSIPTILIVEDDALSRKMVENSLEDGSKRLIIAKNGEEALAALAKEKVDLLVVDLYLKNPDDPASQMDGEEVLQKASAIVNIPAIVVTGKELVDDISLDPKWFELHVKDFIQKGNPFWIDELKIKVKDIIAKR